MASRDAVQHGRREGVQRGRAGLGERSGMVVALRYVIAAVAGAGVRHPRTPLATGTSAHRLPRVLE